MKTERLEWVDIAKGIGIILVTIGHTRLSGGPVGMWLTQFHMPLFFIMAGLCFDETRYPKFGDYFKRKLVALGYPYVMLTLVVASLYAVLCFDPQRTLIGLFLNTLKGWSCGPLWFVSALFFVELIFWGVCRVTDKWYGRLLLSLMFATIGWKIYTEHNSAIWWETPVVMYSVLFYWFGWQMRKWRECFSRKLVLGFGWVVLGAFSIATVVIHPYDYGLAGMNIVNPIWFASIGIAGTSFAALSAILLSRIDSVKKILVWFGKNTLPLLALHCACGICGHSWGLSGTMTFALEYMLMAVLALLISGPLSFFARPTRGGGGGSLK